MRLVQRGNKIFLRHWLKWYVMDADQIVFLAVEEMTPLFYKTPNELKG